MHDAPNRHWLYRGEIDCKIKEDAEVSDHRVSTSLYVGRGRRLLSHFASPGSAGSAYVKVSHLRTRNAANIDV